MDAYEEQQKREDARFALVCSVLAEINRDPKSRKTPYRVEDFMPHKKTESLESKLKKFKGYLRAVDGNKNR